MGSTKNQWPRDRSGVEEGSNVGGAGVAGGGGGQAEDWKGRQSTNLRTVFLTPPFCSAIAPDAVLPLSSPST